MCIHCGDLPTFRYRFANGQTFTSSMAFEYANAQAQAHGIKIVQIDRYVDGEWETLLGDGPTPVAHDEDGARK